MVSYETKIRVRYGETDQMGYLYYGHYALYYEVGRADWLRSLGFAYKALEESGIIMPVVKLVSNYLRPAKYDDLLTVRTILKEKPGQKIILHCEISNEKGKLLNTGSVTLT
jgi:acyl-CoA thioester hydrolase